ncbi:MAG: hypothetical protein ABWY06_21670 [Pseudomonas sp.]|uniref:hypothetical protein n=1 Tax=Pseudomonas sp. TaxID=306 RepID=UPI00339669C2
MHKLIFTAIALLVLLVVLVFASAKFYFWQPSQFTADSLAYRLKVHSAIKAFPVWAPIAPPLYLLRVADGAQRSLVAMTYHSELEQDDLLDRIQALGFTCAPALEQVIQCLNKTDSLHEVSVSLSRKKPGEKIRIETTFIGYGDE